MRRQSVKNRGAARHSQQRELNEMLLDACYARKLPLIQEALREGADLSHFEVQKLDAHSQLIWTPVTAAMIGEFDAGPARRSRDKTIAVLKALTKAGAALDIGVTSIVNLVGDIAGETDILPLLIEAGLVIDENNAYETVLTPLSAGDVNALTALVQKGIDLNARNSTGYTALHTCIMADELGEPGDEEAPGSLPHVQYLVNLLEHCASLGMDLNARTREGLSGLQMAMFADNADVAGALVLAGASPNPMADPRYDARHQHFHAPIVLAARAGEVELMRLMLAHGADYSPFITLPARLAAPATRPLSRWLRAAALNEASLSSRTH